MGTSRPIPEMEVVVDYFMHIPWPVWYKQYIVHVTGSAMPAQPGGWVGVGMGKCVCVCVCVCV